MPSGVVVGRPAQQPHVDEVVAIQVHVVALTVGEGDVLAPPGGVERDDRCECAQLVRLEVATRQSAQVDTGHVGEDGGRPGRGDPVGRFRANGVAVMADLLR